MPVLRLNSNQRAGIFKPSPSRSEVSMTLGPETGQHHRTSAFGPLLSIIKQNLSLTDAHLQMHSIEDSISGSQMKITYKCFSWTKLGAQRYDSVKKERGYVQTAKMCHKSWTCSPEMAFNYFEIEDQASWNLLQADSKPGVHSCRGWGTAR